MGSFLRNFLVRHGDPERIGTTLTKWLERKGFDPVSRPLLFPCEEDHERGLFLVSNSEWVTVLFSESIQEGDRLLQTLPDEAAIVDVWVHDSDIWGYDLLEKGALTVSFNSNPRYFGSDEQKLPDNGDPEKLCQALGLAGRESRVRAAQKRRAMFTDFTCEEFCEAIQAPAGSFHFDTMDEWNQGRLEARVIAGWTVQPLFFERRRPIHEEPRRLELHSLAVRAFERREREQPGVPAEYVRQWQSQMRLITWTVRVIGFFLKPLFWIIGLLFRFHFRKYVHQLQQGQSPAPAGKTGANPLADALSHSPNEFEPSGDWLVNRRHHCRIRWAPSDSRSTAGRPLLSVSGIFFFAVDDVKVDCHALRPEVLSRAFQLSPNASVVADEKFFAGPHPARRLVTRWKHGEKTSFNYQWFVELADAIYVFTTMSATELPQKIGDRIQTIVQSFEQTD